MSRNLLRAIDLRVRKGLTIVDTCQEAGLSPAGWHTAMRHDPASGATVIMLRSLTMHGMAQAATDLMDQGAPAFEAAMPILSQLPKAEVAEREVRSIASPMKAPRFPAYKDLAGFDFAASDVNEALVCTAAR